MQICYPLEIKLLLVLLLLLSIARSDKFYFFYLGFKVRQDYITYFEPSQSVGGTKTGDPREKVPDHPQAELGLSHM